MDWDDLRLFLALARTRRLGAAARVMAVNATTIGRRIQRLERVLETTLFENALTGYVLTADGVALLERAENMEREVLQLGQTGNAGDRSLSGLIRLSTSEGFGTHVLAPRLPSFTASHPAVTVDLIASTGFLNPSRREADLAIMLSRPKAGPLLVRSLTNYRLGLYASAKYIEKMGMPQKLSDLFGQPLVGYVPDLIYAPELDYLAELDVRLKATVRSSSINAQAELVSAGAGCGILPYFIAARSPGLVRILPTTAPLTRTFWLVVHRDVRRLARIERFLTWLDTAVADAAPALLDNADDAAVPVSGLAG